MPTLVDIIVAEDYVVESTRRFPQLFGRLISKLRRKYIIRTTLDEIEFMEDNGLSIDADNVLRRIIPSIRASSDKPYGMPITVWIYLAEIIIRIVVAWWHRRHAEKWS